MDINDANNILTKALEEFPIKDLEISLPDYIEAIGDDIEIKKQILDVIKQIELKYQKVKDITNIRNQYNLLSVHGHKTF